MDQLLKLLELFLFDDSLSFLEGTSKSKDRYKRKVSFPSLDVVLKTIHSCLGKSKAFLDKNNAEDTNGVDRMIERVALMMGNYNVVSKRHDKQNIFWIPLALKRYYGCGHAVVLRCVYENNSLSIICINLGWGAPTGHYHHWNIKNVKESDCHNIINDFIKKITEIAKLPDSKIPQDGLVFEFKNTQPTYISTPWKKQSSGTCMVKSTMAALRFEGGEVAQLIQPLIKIVLIQRYLDESKILFKNPVSISNDADAHYALLMLLGERKILPNLARRFEKHQLNLDDQILVDLQDRVHERLAECTKWLQSCTSMNVPMNTNKPLSFKVDQKAIHSDPKALIEGFNRNEEWIDHYEFLMMALYQEEHPVMIKMMTQVMAHVLDLKTNRSVNTRDIIVDLYIKNRARLESLLEKIEQENGVKGFGFLNQFGPEFIFLRKTISDAFFHLSSLLYLVKNGNEAKALGVTVEEHSRNLLHYYYSFYYNASYSRWRRGLTLAYCTDFPSVYQLEKINIIILGDFTDTLFEIQNRIIASDEHIISKQYDEAKYINSAIIDFYIARGEFEKISRFLPMFGVPQTLFQWSHVYFDYDANNRDIYSGDYLPPNVPRYRKPKNQWVYKSQLSSIDNTFFTYRPENNRFLIEVAYLEGLEDMDSLVLYVLARLQISEKKGSDRIEKWKSFLVNHKNIFSATSLFIQNKNISERKLKDIIILIFNYHAENLFEQSRKEFISWLHGPEILQAAIQRKDIIYCELIWQLVYILGGYVEGEIDVDYSSCLIDGLKLQLNPNASRSRLKWLIGLRCITSKVDLIAKLELSIAEHIGIYINCDAEHALILMDVFWVRTGKIDGIKHQFEPLSGSTSGTQYKYDDGIIKNIHSIVYVEKNLKLVKKPYGLPATKDEFYRSLHRAKVKVYSEILDLFKYDETIETWTFKDEYNNDFKFTRGRKLLLKYDDNWYQYCDHIHQKQLTVWRFKEQYLLVFKESQLKLLTNHKFEDLSRSMSTPDMYQMKIGKKYYDFLYCHEEVTEVLSHWDSRICEFRLINKEKNIIVYPNLNLILKKNDSNQWFLFGRPGWQLTHERPKSLLGYGWGDWLLFKHKAKLKHLVCFINGNGRGLSFHEFHSTNQYICDSRNPGKGKSFYFNLYLLTFLVNCQTDYYAINYLRCLGILEYYNAKKLKNIPKKPEERGISFVVDSVGSVILNEECKNINRVNNLPRFLVPLQNRNSHLLPTLTDATSFSKFKLPNTVDFSLWLPKSCVEKYPLKESKNVPREGQLDYEYQVADVKIKRINTIIKDFKDKFDAHKEGWLKEINGVNEQLVQFGQHCLERIHQALKELRHPLVQVSGSFRPYYNEDMNSLYHVFIHNDEDIVNELNIQDLSVIDLLRNYVSSYLWAQTELQHLNKIHALLESDSNGSDYTIKTVYELMSQRRIYQYDQVEDYPLLLLEYFKGLRLRSVQRTMYDNMLKPSKLISVEQGKGKTTMLLPILARSFVQSQKKSQLVIMVLHDALYSTQSNELSKELQRIYGIESQHLERALSAYSVDDYSKHAQVYFATRECLQKQELLTLTKGSPDHSFYTKVFPNASLIIDEMPLVLDYTVSTIMPVGKKIPLSNTKLSFFVKFYHLLIHSKILNDFKNNMISGLQGVRKKSLLLHNSYYEKSYKNLIKNLSKFSKTLLSVEEVKRLNELLKNPITGDKRIELLKEESKVAWAYEIIFDLVPFKLSLVYRSDYGPDLKKPHLMVPYREGEPTKLQFSKVTQQAFLSIAVLFDDHSFDSRQFQDSYRTFIKKLVDDYCTQFVAGLPVEHTTLKQIFSAQRFSPLFDFLNKDVQCNDKRAQFVSEVIQLLYSKDIHRSVRDNFIYNWVLVTLKKDVFSYYESHYESDPENIRLHSTPSCFAGSAQFFLSRDYDQIRSHDLSSSGRLVRHLVQMEEQGHIVFKKSESLNSWDVFQDASAMVDGGFFITKTDVKEHARNMLSALKEKTYLLFWFDNKPHLLSKTDLMVLDDVTPASLSDAGVNDMKQCFVWFDQARSSGTDVVMNRDAHFLVTVNMLTSLSQFHQYWGRARQAGNGQKLTLILSDELWQKVEKNNKISIKNVCSFLDRQDQNQEPSQQREMAFQQIRQIYRSKMIKEWLEQKKVLDESLLLSHVDGWTKGQFKESYSKWKVNYLISEDDEKFIQSRLKVIDGHQQNSIPGKYTVQASLTVEQNTSQSVNVQHVLSDKKTFIPRELGDWNIITYEWPHPEDQKDYSSRGDFRATENFLYRIVEKVECKQTKIMFIPALWVVFDKHGAIFIHDHEEVPDAFLGSKKPIRELTEDDFKCFDQEGDQHKKQLLKTWIVGGQFELVLHYVKNKKNHDIFNKNLENAFKYWVAFYYKEAHNYTEQLNKIFLSKHINDATEKISKFVSTSNWLIKLRKRMFKYAHRIQKEYRKFASKFLRNYLSQFFNSEEDKAKSSAAKLRNHFLIEAGMSLNKLIELKDKANSSADKLRNLFLSRRLKKQFSRFKFKVKFNQILHNIAGWLPFMALFLYIAYDKLITQAINVTFLNLGVWLASNPWYFVGLTPLIFFVGMLCAFRLADYLMVFIKAKLTDSRETMYQSYYESIKRNCSQYKAGDVENLTKIDIKVDSLDRCEGVPCETKPGNGL
ncbi:MAG: hypothetical protein ACON5A_01270 [Candidatus Comchoanobacterales bacterium]